MSARHSNPSPDGQRAPTQEPGKDREERLCERTHVCPNWCTRVLHSETITIPGVKKVSANGVFFGYPCSLLRYAVCRGYLSMVLSLWLYPYGVSRLSVWCASGAVILKHVLPRDGVRFSRGFSCQDSCRSCRVVTLP